MFVWTHHLRPSSTLGDTTIHFVDGSTAPVTVGAGTRLWKSPGELDDRFQHEQVASPTGLAVHHLYWRR